MWRTVYSLYKLSGPQKEQLNVILEEFLFTCGSSLSDLDVPEGLIE